MWQLKFEYSHKDCLYSHKIKELNLVMYGYPLYHNLDNKKLKITGIQIINGNLEHIKDYIKYLKKNKNIKNVELISENTLIFQTIIKENIFYYQNLYNYNIFYQSPIIHENGKEIFTVASWDRKFLENVIKNISKNRNTFYFKLIYLKAAKLKELFIPQILPKLTKRQREVIKLAKERGYWEYPKKTNLDKLAAELKLSKSTVHEILKRGELKLLNYFI